MLDWDSLIGAEKEAKTPVFTPQPGLSPVQQRPARTLPGLQESSIDGACVPLVPVVPAVPVKKQGDGKEIEKFEVRGGVAADELCARKQREKQEGKHPLNVEAVALVLAYCEKAGASMDEITVALVGLLSMPPDEQARRWRQSCMEEGITP